MVILLETCDMNEQEEYGSEGRGGYWLLGHDLFCLTSVLVASIIAV